MVLLCKRRSIDIISPFARGINNHTQRTIVPGTVKSKNEVLLKTVSVLAVGENSGTSVPTLMLLDDGSQKSYITNSLKTQLNLKPVKKQTVYLNTFGSDHYQKHVLDVLRRISCHGRNQSQASCEYSLTVFLCCQHHSEYSLLGSKFSTNLLFAASKCHVTIQQRGSSRCSKWPNDRMVAVVKHCWLPVQGRRGCRER